MGDISSCLPSTGSVPYPHPLSCRHVHPSCPSMHIFFRRHDRLVSVTDPVWMPRDPEINVFPKSLTSSLIYLPLPGSHYLSAVWMSVRLTVCWALNDFRQDDLDSSQGEPTGCIAFLSVHKDSVFPLCLSLPAHVIRGLIYTAKFHRPSIL